MIYNNLIKKNRNPKSYHTKNILHTAQSPKAFTQKSNEEPVVQFKPGIQLNRKEFRVKYNDIVGKGMVSTLQ